MSDTVRQMTWEELLENRNLIADERNLLKAELEKFKEAMREQNHSGGCTSQIHFWKTHADEWEKTGMNALAECNSLKEDLRLSRITIKADDEEIFRLKAEVDNLKNWNATYSQEIGLLMAERDAWEAKCEVLQKCGPTKKGRSEALPTSNNSNVVHDGLQNLAKVSLKREVWKVKAEKLAEALRIIRDDKRTPPMWDYGAITSFFEAFRLEAKAALAEFEKGI